MAAQNHDPRLALFFCLALFAAAIDAADTANFTVALPSGTTNHGNPQLLCTPTQWADYISFFVGNYVTHALTVVVLPGEEPASYLTNALTSLLFPAFGAYRGLRAISVGYVSVRKSLRKGWGWRSVKEWVVGGGDADDESELQKARRCGALCMVVRSAEWEPRDGDEVEAGGCTVWVEPNTLQVEDGQKEVKTKGEIDVEQGNAAGRETDKQALLTTTEVEVESVELSDRSPPSPSQSGTVQISTYSAPWTYCREEGPDAIGSRTVRSCPSSLSPGYELIMVPSCTPVRELASDTATDRIGSSYSLVKGIIALAQAGFAVQTLYQTRGDQIKEYGYAAFGLTVAPYALMSFVNLLGALSRPEYDAVYLVGGDVMLEERRRRGLDGYYEGVVGEVVPSGEEFGFGEKGSYKTTPGMHFVSETLKYEHQDGVPSIELTNADGQVVRYTIKKQEPGSPLSAELPQLFIPSTPPFAYHPKNAAPQTDCVLPYPEFAPARSRWDLPLSSCGVTSVLPRSVRYLEHSRSLSFVVSLLPLIPIGVLSHFKKGDNSKVSQRVVTMLWLAWGAVMGYLIAELGTKDVLGERVKGKMRLGSVLGRVVWYLVVGAPAIAGYVIVGLMLRDFGTCVVLPG